MKTGLFISRGDGVISEAIEVDSLAQRYDHLTIATVINDFSSAEDQQEILKPTVQELLDFRRAVTGMEDTIIISLILSLTIARLVCLDGLLTI